VQYDGATLSEHQVQLITRQVKARPQLAGTWFEQGVMGSMGELLCAMEKKRMPLNNPLDNLRGLSICFAAVVSAQTGKTQTVGKVRQATLETCMVADA
jgi:hypothetical protein